MYHTTPHLTIIRSNVLNVIFKSERKRLRADRFDGQVHLMEPRCRLIVQHNCWRIICHERKSPLQILDSFSYKHDLLSLMTVASINLTRMFLPVNNTVVLKVLRWLNQHIDGLQDTESDLSSCRNRWPLHTSWTFKHHSTVTTLQHSH